MKNTFNESYLYMFFEEIEFISVYDDEEIELDFELWCWSKEINRMLDKL